jgi:hypothetical protein
MTELTIYTVFSKIKEISAASVRPYIRLSELATELGTSATYLAPCLEHLKRMRLIIFHKDDNEAIKLTVLGTGYDMMPR